MQRVCSKCGDPKDGSEFHKGQSRCKLCRVGESAQYHADNRERNLIRMRTYRAEHHAEILSYLREDSLKRNYNITLEQYLAMFDAQGGVCAICGRPETTRDWRGDRPIKNLSVDHDHACCLGSKSCGRCVRGLICFQCNKWMGVFDALEWNEKAAKYVSDYQQRRLMEV